MAFFFLLMHKMHTETEPKPWPKNRGSYWNVGWLYCGIPTSLNLNPNMTTHVENLCVRHQQVKTLNQSLILFRQSSCHQHQWAITHKACLMYQCPKELLISHVKGIRKTRGCHGLCPETRLTTSVDVNVCLLEYLLTSLSCELRSSTITCSLSIILGLPSG